jgi:hypothetical protein
LGAWGAALLAAIGLLSGCAATSVMTFAYEQANEGQCLSAGCVAQAVLKHALDKATEGDPTPCYKLNTVERALSSRCGEYRPGTLLTKDVKSPALPQCPLTLAARDPALWPVLPELLSKGASPESCDTPPLVALAQAQACPDFPAAGSETVSALRWLAVGDARSIHHDVVRMLSCPAARTAGLAGVLDDWLAHGQLPTRGLTFGVLGALHPTYLDSDFARTLEARGHTARDGLGPYAGQLTQGFDAALRDGNPLALDWWLSRVPELANRVPPRDSNQLAWVPLARVVTPNYLAQPERQTEIVAYLLAHGADPTKPLPHNAAQSALTLARSLNSPSLALMEQPAGRTSVTAATVAVSPARALP